jgi:hypothetical protein
MQAVEVATVLKVTWHYGVAKAVLENANAGIETASVAVGIEPAWPYHGQGVLCEKGALCTFRTRTNPFQLKT